MGLFKWFQKSPSTQTEQRSSFRRSFTDSIRITKNRVTEATLLAWRNLPGEIRQDPSMINFQREAERWKGKVTLKNLRSFQFRDSFFYGNHLL